MILLLCHSCNHGLRISPGVDGERSVFLAPGDDWYPDKYPCFHCGGFARISPPVADESFRQLNVIDVSPVEALAAINGLGLPEERDCNPTSVKQLLSNAKIKNVGTRTIRDSHRCILEYLELEDGTRVYLSASSFGATVYRISGRPNYTEKSSGD